MINKLKKQKTKLEYFFIGWEESDSHDECVAKFGKWHVPEKHCRRLCCARKCSNVFY